MKKIRRWTALMLTAVLLFTPRLAVFAECWHDGTPTEFDYRRLSDAEGDIDTYAKCSQCGEWYLYCTAHPSATSPAPEHSWEMVDVSMTTCTADGWYKIRCSHCGAEQVTVTDKAYGHRFGEWTMTKAPTCEADGVRERVCEECCTKETQAIPATGHAFGDWAMTKAPTCEADGVRTRTCSTCGKTETSGVPATGHAYGEWVLTTPPTCEADGVRTRTCSRCGKTETSGVPATGHAFGDWVSVKPATSTQPGVEERTCAHCGQKETRETAIDTAVLGVGDTGIKVVILEELLRAGGEFAGEADEEYTDETAAAVNAYRKACGLPETGLADA